jgi:SAM-dependent methyltransferase
MAALDFLKLPEARGISNLDDPAATMLHSRILEKKKFLRRLYTDFYRDIAGRLPEKQSRSVVELGSGGGFIKDFLPDAITSDILDLPHVDKVFSACDMPFEDASLKAIVMIDVLHHINRPERFFDEALRCLAEGGKVVMIEPANTAWSRFIYRNFHHEGFDPDAGWSFDAAGPLSGGNGALPWIIFERDRAKFKKQYPQLSIKSIELHTPLAYLLSGGFTLRQLVPSFCYAPLRAFEYILSPVNKWTAMFTTIELEKTGT